MPQNRSCSKRLSSKVKAISLSQPKQRTSLSSSLDVQRPVNHSCEPSEVSSSLGYASFSTSPPASPPLSPNQEDSAGSNDDCQLTGKPAATVNDSFWHSGVQNSGGGVM